MRRSLALAFVPLLMGMTPAQENLPVRQVVGNMCGFVVDPPKTLREWRDRADLVIHVRIDSQVAFEHETHGRDSHGAVGAARQSQVSTGDPQRRVRAVCT